MNGMTALPHRPLAAGMTAALLLTPLAACTPTPQGTARFHSQRPDWTACAGYGHTEIETTVLGAVPGLQCTRIEVPLDHTKPEGRTIRIAVAKLAAPATEGRIGSLVLNPGGPGGSGVFAAAATALGLAKAQSPLLGRFDLVGFDPRGVGASQPAVDCYTDAEADAGPPALSTQGTTVTLTEADTRAILDRCAGGSGGADVLAHLGTRDAARDMDVLRAVLGDEKLTFLGQSYGTRLGAVYAEQFPANVRAMVLDGAIDPRQGTVQRRAAAYGSFQKAFDRMAAACTKQADCPLGDDPARAVTEFQRLVRPLATTPVPGKGRPVDFDTAVGGVISGLYTPAAWPRITKGLTELRGGRADELLQLGLDFSGRDSRGRWTNFPEANFAVNCMDEDRLTERQGNELRAAILTAAPFMDPGTDVTTGAREGCEHWPAPPSLGYPYAQDIDGLPPTLVVSITGDPTTPHAGGISLAQSLGSSLLTVEGEGHTIVTAGTNRCVNDAAAAYLIELEVPADGATCTS